MSAPVICYGPTHAAPKILRRDEAWQRFTMLRRLAVKGGGRQRTKAGVGLDEFYCDGCALREDALAKGIPWDGPAAKIEAEKLL